MFDFIFGFGMGGRRRVKGLGGYLTYGGDVLTYGGDQIRLRSE